MLVAMGAEVRLRTLYKDCAYEMTLDNQDPQMNNFVEKV